MEVRGQLQVRGIGIDQTTASLIAKDNNDIVLAKLSDKGNLTVGKDFIDTTGNITAQFHGFGSTNATETIRAYNSVGIIRMSMNNAGTLSVWQSGSTIGDYVWEGYAAASTGDSTSRIGADGAFQSLRNDTSGYFLIGSTNSAGGGGILQARAAVSGSDVYSRFIARHTTRTEGEVEMNGYSPAVDGALIKIYKGSISLSDTWANSTLSTSISGNSVPGSILRAFNSVDTTLPLVGNSPLIRVTNEMADTPGTGYKVLALQQKVAGGSNDQLQFCLALQTLDNTSLDGDANLIWWTQRTGATEELLTLNNKTKDFTVHGLAGVGDREIFVDANGVLKVGGAVGGGGSLYTADSTVGSGRIATLTDSLNFTHASFANTLHLDGTNGRVGIGTNAPLGTLQIQSRSTSSAATALTIRNSANNRMMEINDAGNIAMGTAAPLTNARLYVHSINSTLTYGINAPHTNNTGNAQHIFSVQGNGNVWNQFSAAGLGAGNNVRAAYFIATNSQPNHNYGAYATARNSANTNWAFYANMQSGGTGANSNAFYALLADSNGRTNRSAFQASITNSTESNAVTYGTRILANVAGALTNPQTTYGFHFTSNVNDAQNVTMKGIYINLTAAGGPGAGTTLRAIETDGLGDVRFAYLAGTGNRPVYADANGILKIGGDEPLILLSYTVATVPSAVSYTDGVIIVTDEIGGRTLATSDGVNWRRISDGAIIS